MPWKLVIFRATGENPIITRTANMSSRGFYCYVPRSFPIGAELNCALTVPGEAGSKPSTLRARARVVRSDPPSCSGFGLACVIEDYSFESTGSPELLIG